MRLAGLHGLDRPASFLDQDPVLREIASSVLARSRWIAFSSLLSTKEAEGGNVQRWSAAVIGRGPAPWRVGGTASRGALAVLSHRVREFRAAEERLLTVLADDAAVAIENARLYGRLQAQPAELGRAQAQLLQTEKIAAMGQLLAGVAHELNNPLAVVMGRAELLTRQLRGTPRSGAVEKLSAAAEGCARIVKNFLALARNDEPSRTFVHVNSVIGEAVELLTFPLRADGVELSLVLASDLPPIWADTNQLHQVLINLVTNAHHAMRDVQSSRRLSITTSADRPRERGVLQIADTGSGIRPSCARRSSIHSSLRSHPAKGPASGLALLRHHPESPRFHLGRGGGERRRRVR